MKLNEVMKDNKTYDFIKVVVNPWSHCTINAYLKEATK
jgi:hypothetical protein